MWALRPSSRTRVCRLLASAALPIDSDALTGSAAACAAEPATSDARHSRLATCWSGREEEILATEMMQRGASDKANFYILFRRGPAEGTVEAFYRLLFEPWRKKAYLSFPMTHVMHLPQVIREIEDFPPKSRDT